MLNTKHWVIFLLYLFAHLWGQQVEYYPIPVLSFDTDLGIRAGLSHYIYRIKDATSTPPVLWTGSIETDITTQHAYAFQVLFDSYTYFQKWRISAEITSTGEPLTNFYGFNGLQTTIYPEFTNKEKNNYVSNTYYNLRRRLWRITSDFFLPTSFNNTSVFAGLHYYAYDLNSARNLSLNHGKFTSPDTITLYDYYTISQIIAAKDAMGGKLILGRAGFLFDSRNSPFNPTKGVYVESIMSYGFVFHSTFFVRLNQSVRWFIPIIDDKITFAIRGIYQDHVFNEAPFYFSNFISAANNNTLWPEGLGGVRSMRGIWKNRILAQGFLLGNVEPRIRVWKFKIKRNQIDLLFTSLLDAAKIVRPFKISPSLDLPGYPPLGINDKPDLAWHSSYGSGFYLVLNKKMVLSVIYANAFNPQLGSPSWYATTGFSF